MPEIRPTMPDDDAHHRPATTYRLGEPTGVKGVYILEFLLSETTGRNA